MKLRHSMDIEKNQKEFFNKIAVEYGKHYSDECSQKYRQKFINTPLLKDIPLQGRRVLEAMCGSGQTTSHLISKGTSLTCLDISEECLKSLRRKFPSVNMVCSTMTGSGLESDYFDCVVVVGGLHHLHPNIDRAIDEIYRILKVGGYLCFFEPHSNSLPDLIRKYWYKRDKYFEANEASINIKKLKSKHNKKFKFLKEYYSGNLAYLLIYNSLIFRIPLRFKKFYTPSLLFLESIIKIFQCKLLSCFVICQWQKK